MSIAADVLWTSVVRRMRGVGGVLEMCMCLALGGVGGVDEWIGFEHYQSCGNGGVLDVCLSVSFESGLSV